MKKIALLMIIFTLFSVNTYADTLIKIVLDGKELVTDVSPIMIDDTILVPIRPVFEELGLKLNWDSEREVVQTISMIGELKIRIGSRIVSLNSNKVLLLPTYPRVINGRTMVPIRFIAESMKANVNWIESANTVNITTVK